MTRRQTRKKWTADEWALLSARTKEGEAAKDIASVMGRTKTSVQNMQKIIGLMTPRSELALQPDEERLLRENPDMSAVEIAERIGRTPAAVRAWRRKIGLPRYQDHARWTRDETDLLMSNLQRPLSELYALFPGRLKAPVNAKVKSLGRRRLRRKGHTYSSGYKHLVQRGGIKILEHRAVAEEKIGRPLRREEVVHRINYIRHDNRPSNLDVLENGSVHARIQKPVNGLIGGLLEGDEIGYDRGAHSYFIPSRSFDPEADRGASSSGMRMPDTSYVFCGDRIFPFSLQPDVGLAKTLAKLPHANSTLPMEGRHAVILFGAAASPAFLEGALGAGSIPFPAVRGRIADHDMVPVQGTASADCLMRDTLKPCPGASAVVWVVWWIPGSSAQWMHARDAEGCATWSKCPPRSSLKMARACPRRTRTCRTGICRPCTASDPYGDRRRRFPACSYRSSAREQGGAQPDAMRGTCAHLCRSLPCPTLRCKPRRTVVDASIPPSRPSIAESGRGRGGRQWMRHVRPAGLSFTRTAGGRKPCRGGVRPQILKQSAMYR